MGVRWHPRSPSPPSQLKEEAGGTLDAVQVLAGVSQLLPKSRENYLNRCMDQERLRRESTSQKEMDKVSPRLPVSSPYQPTSAGPGSWPRRGGCLMGERKCVTELWLSNLSVVPMPWAPQEVQLLGQRWGEAP